MRISRLFHRRLWPLFMEKFAMGYSYCVAGVLPAGTLPWYFGYDYHPAPWKQQRLCNNVVPDSPVNVADSVMVHFGDNRPRHDKDVNLVCGTNGSPPARNAKSFSLCSRPGTVAGTVRGLTGVTGSGMLLSTDASPLAELVLKLKAAPKSGIEPTAHGEIEERTRVRVPGRGHRRRFLVNRERRCDRQVRRPTSPTEADVREQAVIPSHAFAPLPLLRLRTPKVRPLHTLF